MTTLDNSIHLDHSLIIQLHNDLGGNTGHKELGNGEGGYSYASSELMYVHFLSGINHGPGEVYIIPAISGCGCDFRCISLDQYLSETKCLCPSGWLLSNNSRSCVREYHKEKKNKIISFSPLEHNFAIK